MRQDLSETHPHTHTLAKEVGVCLERVNAVQALDPLREGEQAPFSSRSPTRGGGLSSPKQRLSQNFSSPGTETCGRRWFRDVGGGGGGEGAAGQREGGMDESHVSSAPAVLGSQRWFCRCRPGATRGSGGDKRDV